jgi:hypothetical protein
MNLPPIDAAGFLSCNTTPQIQCIQMRETEQGFGMAGFGMAARQPAGHVCSVHPIRDEFVLYNDCAECSGSEGSGWYETPYDLQPEPPQPKIS